MILLRADVASLDFEGRNDGAINAASFEHRTLSSRFSRSREVIDDSRNRCRQVTKQRKLQSSDCLTCSSLTL
jgi:hypothetical protein